MDQIDRQLVALLQSNAQLTYEELGKAVGLSTAAAYQRVRKLEESGVVLGYHAAVAPAAVGRPVLAFARVRPGPETDVEQLQRSWEMSGEVLECHVVTGDAGFLLKLRLKGIDDLEPHLALARRAGCLVSADIVVTTAFERWTVPVA
jgi:Lrp/AsnC family leucine-responsive transcriptional regulator